MTIALSGWSYNNDGTPAQNLVVNVYDQVPNLIGTTSTNASGFWQFATLTSGITYDVKINNNGVIKWIKGGEQHQVASLNLTGALTISALWDFSGGSLVMPIQAAVTSAAGRFGLTAAGGSMWFADGTVSRTVATLDQTQSLTNKTINGLGSAVTGSGSLVGATSPVLTTPTLNSFSVSGTVSGVATWSSGPYSGDWFRNTVTATGIYNGAAGQGIAFNSSGAYLYPSGIPIVGRSAPDLYNPRILGPGGAYVTTGNDLTNYVFNYGTGTYTLPTPSAAYTGVYRLIKAWGGSVTVNCGVAQIAAPGGTAMVSSYTLGNGESATCWCDGTYWWAL